MHKSLCNRMVSYMRQTKYMKPSVLLLFSVGILLLLSACSGVIGGDNMVRISVPGMADSGRFISSSANSGYVVVLQGNKVYSLNNFSDKAYQDLVDGNVFIANLPVGTYIFGVVLIDDKGTSDENDDDNVGLAIKKRKVEAGFNDILIDVGPGITTFDINGISFENFFIPDGFTVSFDEDTIILDIDRNPAGADVVDLAFNGGGTTSGDIIVDGVASGSPVIAIQWDIAANEDGVETITTGLPPLSEYKLSVILK
jgi:hypothetical protein